MMELSSADERSVSWTDAARSKPIPSAPHALQIHIRVGSPLVDEVVEVPGHEVCQDADHSALAVDDARADLQKVRMPAGRCQQPEL